MGRLLDAGYGVISIDERGHGESGGKIRILDPDFEGKDLVQIIDWAEDHLAWLAYRNANLILGAIGGSYGGGFQHTIYAHDPQKRLDAIAPEITWHDLRYSLFSGGVFKTFWAVTLSAAGNATPGGQDQEVNDGLVNGPHHQLAHAGAAGPPEKGEPDLRLRGRHPLQDGRALLAVGERHALQHERRRAQLRLRVGPRRRRPLPHQEQRPRQPLPGSATGEQCGELDKTQSIVDWYDEKLKDIAGKASYIPQHCFHIDGTTDDGVVTDTLPIGGQVAVVPQTAIIAQDASPQVASIVLATVGAGGAVLAGIPTIQLTVTDPSGLELGDPILFLGSRSARRAG
jgi:hypothetical protein